MKAEIIERMRLFYLKKYEGVSMCVNCQHFHQHYIRDGKGHVAVECGHCVEPRIKNREPWDSCQHFTPKVASAPGKAQTK